MRFLTCSVLAAALVACGGGGTNGSGGAPGSGGSGGLSTSTSSSGSGTSTAQSSSSSSAGSGGAGGASVSSSAATTGTGGAGPAPNSGDCNTDADCPGSQCVEVTPGGFRVCLVVLQKATTCDHPALDQCCSTMPCPDSQSCYLGPLTPFCGGVPMAPYNQCAVDQCSQDADCALNQICGVAGTLDRKIRSCVPAPCKRDTECIAQQGGECAPVLDPCCGSVNGLYCVYPNVGCRKNGDCGQNRYCQITGNEALCQPGGPVCPL